MQKNSLSLKVRQPKMLRAVLWIRARPGITTKLKLTRSTLSGCDYFRTQEHLNGYMRHGWGNPLFTSVVVVVVLSCSRMSVSETFPIRKSLHVALGEAWKAALVERLAFLFPGENSFVLMFYWVNTIKTVCATIFLVMGHKFLAIYPCMQGFLDILRMFMVGIECAGFRLPSLTLSQPWFLFCSYYKLLPPPGSVRLI